MQISVVSGKGGTGKSSIAAAFASLEKSVILADCDVDAANQFLLFDPLVEEEQVYVAGHKAVINYDKCDSCGLCMSFCRFGAISQSEGKVVISGIDCDGCFLCRHICLQNAITMAINDRSKMYSGTFRYGKMVYGRLAPGEENSGKLVNMVREKARNIATENNIEIILIDGPPGTGCPVISSITGADKIVIVTEPTRSGLNDLQRLYGIVSIVKQPSEVYVIINKSDLNTSFTESLTRWCLSHGLKVAGTVPFDRSVTEAMVQANTVIEYSPDSELSETIKNLWINILYNQD